MDRAPDNWIARRSLFKGRLFEIAHVVCRPTPDLRHDVAYAGLNVLALPTAGVFALHPSVRRHVVATPNHAVFISSGRPYRVTFPGCIGDECLTLHLSAEGLARLVPEAMARDGFDESTLFARAVLPPAAILARSLLLRGFVRGEADPLQVEELGIGLLGSALSAVGAPRPMERERGSPHVERVKELISTSPERKWTLAELAETTGVSPCHLAHVFNREVGTSVYRYAIRSRLAKALDAVLDSDRDLTTIALDAGFATQSHFNAGFPAIFRLAPEGLRRCAPSGHAARVDNGGSH